jgi:gamma-glutamylcyclotransferase (GGCT)/AIG2-like uncharacterized protein YtfP
LRLFLYGVLREGLGDWPFLAGLGPGRPAQTSGDLFAIADPHGWYPALRHGQGPGWAEVVGTLHDAQAVDLAAVDAFEGPDYTRRRIPVWFAGETITADAYLWTAPFPAGALWIAHGDFARWLAETGLTPFGGQ